ncbi:hypothetical protein GEMRC1_002350 [Eukaryota sp. GEM-RC1]
MKIYISFEANYYPLSNDDVSNLLNTLQSNTHLNKIYVENSSMGFSNFLTIFELVFSDNLTPNIEVSPHYFDVSLGIIYYENELENSELLLLLKTLKSNLPLNHVKCNRLKNPNLEGLSTLFEIHSLEKLILDIDISPCSINPEKLVFCFSPDHDSSSPITAQEMSSLKSFVNCFGIKELTLKQCSFTCDAMIGLCDLLRGSRSLTSIDFSHIQIYEEDSGYESDEYYNHLSDDDLSKLINALQSNSGLQKINLSNYRMEFDKVLTIFELISSDSLTPNTDVSPHSFDLSLGVIYYQEMVGTSDLSLLLKALRSNVPLTRVECRGLRTRCLEAMIIILEILLINKSMISIDILPNAINLDEGIFYFSRSLTEISIESVSSLQALLQRSGIKQLTLSRCCFTEAAMSSLCDLISTSTSLTMVDFSQCGLCNEILSNLISALQQNISIKRVNLSKNFFGIDTIVSIIELISIGQLPLNFEIFTYSTDYQGGVFSFSPYSSSPFCYFRSSGIIEITAEQVSSLKYYLNRFSIKELTLKRCGFSDDAITVLSDLIRVNNSLMSVDFSDCEFSTDGASQIINAIQSNSCLKLVNFGNNDFDLEFLFTICKLVSAGTLKATIDVSPHSFDLSRGTIHYSRAVEKADLLFLLNTLKSNFPINRVTCYGLKTKNLEVLITLFEILSINKSVIDVDVAPYLIDIENGVFCFSANKRIGTTKVTSEMMTSLQSFLESSRLKKLTLRRCEYSPTLFNALCDSLKVNSSLTFIDFRYCYLLDESVSKLVAALQLNSCLKHIDLEGNDIGFQTVLTIFQRGSIGLFSAIIQKSRHSINFPLGSISCADFVNKDDLDVLLKALKSGVPINRVECRGVKTVSLEVLITLYEILSLNKSVLDINVHPHFIDVANGLFRFSRKKLLKYVRKQGYVLFFNCVGMAELVIIKCRFHAKPFSDLCDLIRFNGSNMESKLTKIDLRFNSIGNEQAIELANALEANSVISEINLYGNSIDSETKQLITRLSNNRIRT